MLMPYFQNGLIMRRWSDDMDQKQYYITPIKLNRLSIPKSLCGLG